MYSYGWGLSPSSWTWGSGSGTSVIMSGYGKMENEIVKSELACGVGGKLVNGSHCSTVERLYAWEKKLFDEVKVRSYEFDLSSTSFILTITIIIVIIVLLWGFQFDLPQLPKANFKLVMAENSFLPFSPFWGPRKRFFFLIL